MYDREAIYRQCVEARDRARQQVTEANDKRGRVAANLANAAAGLARARAILAARVLAQARSI